MSKVKQWMDLAQLFIKQYKFNREIAPDGDKIQRISKKPSEGFREYAQRQRDEAS